MTECYINPRLLLYNYIEHGLLSYFCSSLVCPLQVLTLDCGKQLL